MQKPYVRRLLVLGAAIAATCLALLPGEARAAAGPLDGESLAALFATERADPAPPPSTCDPAGNSTLYFGATGTAAGPYPGTFTETGTITVGPQTLVPPAPQDASGTGKVGTVLTFEAQFRIDSGTTAITGTKTLSATLAGQPFSSTAACAAFADSAALGSLSPDYYATISGRTYFTLTSATYEATISDGTSTTHDSGESLTSFNEVYLTGGTCQPLVVGCSIANSSATNQFSESFASTAVPGPPPSTTGCKVTYGGWITAQDGDRAWFAGLARVGTANALTGRHAYRDSGPALEATFVSTSTTAVVCTGNTAQIYGLGRVDGSSPVAYRIDLTDGGRSDTYRITWTGTTAYDSGERPLEGGNVTLH